jgi:hypothetical protein
MQNGFLDELVGLFELTVTPGLWEVMYDDLAHLDPEELARGFGRVEALLQGIEESAVESFGVPGLLIFGEAKQLAALARYFCEQQAH